MVSPPISVVGVRASDDNGGGVVDDAVSRVGDGAGGGVGDDTCSRVGGGSRAVVGEGVCIGATGGTCCSVSGRTRGDVDDCLDWVCSGAKTTSGARSSGEGRTTLSVEGGSGGDGGSGWVTYQEVAVVSLPGFKCATASPKPVSAVLVMTAATVLAAVVAAPAPLIPQAAYGVAQPSLW